MSPTHDVFQNKRARMFVCSGVSPAVLRVVAVVDNLAVMNGYWLCIFISVGFSYLFIFGVFKDAVSSSDYALWVSE
jgi:hypothetical protein